MALPALSILVAAVRSQGTNHPAQNAAQDFQQHEPDDGRLNASRLAALTCLRRGHPLNSARQNANSPSMTRVQPCKKPTMGNSTKYTAIPLAFLPNSQRNAAMNTAYDSLHHACAALGTRLFTVTVQDVAQNLARRAYTSHPVEYPVSGTKPLTRDGWYDHCIKGQQTFVANTTPEFARYFFDHALITSLGLGSCINIPVVSQGEVVGTVNLLAEEHHFTPEKLMAYEELAQSHHAALVAEMVKS